MPDGSDWRERPEALSPDLVALIEACWAQEAANRPPFEQVSRAHAFAYTASARSHLELM